MPPSPLAAGTLQRDGCRYTTLVRRCLWCKPAHTLGASTIEWNGEPVTMTDGMCREAYDRFCREIDEHDARVHASAGRVPVGKRAAGSEEGTAA